MKQLLCLIPVILFFASGIAFWTPTAFADDAKCKATVRYNQEVLRVDTVADTILNSAGKVIDGVCNRTCLEDKNKEKCAEECRAAAVIESLTCNINSPRNSSNKRKKPSAPRNCMAIFQYDGDSFKIEKKIENQPKSAVQDALTVDACEYVCKMPKHKDKQNCKDECKAGISISGLTCGGKNDSSLQYLPSDLLY